MDNKKVVGRGNKAPYETTHIRVPTVFKEEIQKLVEDCRNLLLAKIEQQQLEIQQQEQEQEENSKCVPLEEIIDLARKLAKDRHKKNHSIEILLSAIYNQDVKL